MSVIQPRHRPLQQFFRTGPMPCPYLPGLVERKLFTRLSGPFAGEVNEALTQAGFRRSHDIIYRPVCPTCAACIPVRVPVALFVPARSQRRVLKRNATVTVTEVAAAATCEQFVLFTNYQQSRHDDSDMARMSAGDYASMIEEGRTETSLFEAREPDGTLIGVTLVDRLVDGLSAVYSFYEPTLEQRSLGSYLILTLIEQCQAEELPFVYLGYWVAGSRKMAYKARFRPLEALGEAGWRLLPDPEPVPEPESLGETDLDAGPVPGLVPGLTPNPEMDFVLGLYTGSGSGSGPGSEPESA